jgi:geranylgeranyl pyrophosphate synthase
MNPYQSTIDFLFEIPIMREWHELRTLLEQAATREPEHWQLPIRICEAMGKPADEAIPAVAAIACAQLSILMIDDMLDEDPRGEYQHLGPARTANFAAAFQAACLEALLHNKWRSHLAIPALRNINRMILLLSFGQHLDVQSVADEAAYWKIVDNKSASFFGTAFYLGALAGGASKTIARNLKQIGHLYGEMIQIHDDLNDTMAVPANPDWLQGRSPLPILFAKVVDHPERARFLELCREAADENALRQAQDILVRCGAVSYCVDQLLRRYESAREILRSVSLVRPESIESLLEQGIAPVRRLFQAVEESLPAPSIEIETGNGA